MNLKGIRSHPFFDMGLAVWTPTRRLLGKVKRAAKRAISSTISAKKINAKLLDAYRSARADAPNAELPPLPALHLSFVDVNFATRALADGLARVTPDAPPALCAACAEFSKDPVVQRIDPELAGTLALRLCAASRSVTKDPALRHAIPGLLRRYAEAHEEEAALLQSKAFQSLSLADADYVRGIIAVQFLRAGRADRAAEISRELLSHAPDSLTLRLRHAIMCLGAELWDEGFALLRPNRHTGSLIGLREAQTILSTFQKAGRRTSYGTLVSELSTRGDFEALAALIVAASAFPFLTGKMLQLVAETETDPVALQDTIAALLLARRRSTEELGAMQSNAIQRELLPLLDPPLAELVSEFLFGSGRSTVSEQEALLRYLSERGRTSLDMTRKFERVLALEGIYDIDQAGQGLRGDAPRRTFADVLGEGSVVVSQGSMAQQYFAQHLQTFSPPVYSLRVEPHIDQLCTVRRVVDMFPLIGSAGDLAAVEEARCLAELVADLVFPNRNKGTDAEAVKEVFSLGLWDRLVTAARTVEALKQNFADSNVERVLMVATGDYAGAMAYAMALKRHLGIPVFITYGGSRHRDELLAAGGTAGQSNAEIIAGAFSKKIIEHERADVPAERLIGAIADAAIGEEIFAFEAQLAARSEQPERIDALVLASMSDSNYFMASEEVARTCVTSHDIAVVNLTPKKVRFLDDTLGDRLLSAPDIPRDDLKSNAYCEDEFRAVLAHLGGPESNLSLLGLVSLPYIANFLLERFPTIMRETCYFQAYAKAHDVRSFILCSGRHITCRAVNLYAKKQGIQTIDVQAFFISEHPRYRASLADIYCGTIQEQIDLYVRSKHPPATQEIVRIGSLPITRRTRAVAGLSSPEARDMLSLPAEGKIIMFATQPGYPAETIQITQILADAIRQRADTMLIVKLHPRTPDPFMEEVRRAAHALGLGERITVLREDDVYKLIVTADLVVTQFSNVGLEAAVLDRLTLAVNLTGAEYPIDLHAMGVAEGALTEDEIKTAVIKLLFDDAARAAAVERRHVFFERNPELKSGSGAAEISAMLPERSGA